MTLQQAPVSRAEVMPQGNVSVLKQQQKAVTHKRRLLEVPCIFIVATVWNNDLCSNSSKLVHHVTAQESSTTKNSGSKTSDRASTSFANRNLQTSSLLENTSAACDEYGVNSILKQERQKLVPFISACHKTH